MGRDPLGTIGFALGVADQIASALWRERIGPNVTQPQFLALLELSGVGPSSQYELAESVGIDKVTIGPVVKRLDGLGWIERGKDRDDARRSVLTIRDEGRAVLAQLLPAAQEMSASFMAPLDPTEAALVVQTWALMAQSAGGIQRPAGRAPARSVAAAPALPSPTAFPWFFLRLARRSYRKVWRELVGEAISPSQYVLMSVVAATPGIDLKTAAGTASVEETTALRIIMRSIRLRLMRDLRDPQQPRRSLLEVTAGGGAEVRAITAALPAVNAALCRPIPPTVLGECERLIRKVARLQPR